MDLRIITAITGVAAVCVELLEILAVIHAIFNARAVLCHARISRELPVFGKRSIDKANWAPNGRLPF